MSSDEQFSRPPVEAALGPVVPTPEETEAARSYEAFEAQAAALHEDPVTPAAGRAAEAAPVPAHGATSGSTGPAVAAGDAPDPAPERPTGMVDELRGSAVGAAKGLAALHLTTTDVAARAIGGLVERAGDASGNERVRGLARGQAGLLRRAAGGYTSLGRRLLG